MQDPDLIVHIIKHLETLQNVDDDEFLWPTLDFISVLDNYICEECHARGALKFESSEDGNEGKAYCSNCDRVELGVSKYEDKPEQQKDIQLYFPFASEWKLERHDEAIKFTVKGLTSVQMRDAAPKS